VLRSNRDDLAALARRGRLGRGRAAVGLGDHGLP
jgi:hypothetical protein